jgi:hypothetical protein
MSSNDSSNVSVSVQPASNDALQKFPAQRERLEFPNWLFKANAFFAAKQLTDVVNHPIISDDDRDRDDLDDTNFIGANLDQKKLTELRQSAKRAYNYIIQSLHPKQIQLVSQIPVGDAYTVMKTLKSNYGIIKSTATIMSLLSKLHLNRKLPNETMNDYFARIDRMISDVRTLDPEIMNDNMKKYFIISGLPQDGEWKTVSTIISQTDSDQKWSVTKLQQYLIDQEDKMTVLSSSSSSSTPPSHRSKHIEVDDNVDITASKAFNASRGGFRGRGRGGRSRGRGSYYHNSNNNNRFQTSSFSSPNQSSLYQPRGRSQRGRGGYNNFNVRRQSIVPHDNNRASSNVKCYTCNKIGHTSSQCINNPAANTQCYTCGKYGHLSSSCFQNQRKRSYNSNSDQYANISSSSPSLPSDTYDADKRQKIFAYFIISQPSCSPVSAAFHTSSSSSTDWIIDGAATDHYCSNLTLMHDIITLSTPRSIITANGTSTCNMIGKVTINIGDHRMVLQDVLYVPDFQVNLMSVYKITLTGADVIYTSDNAYIKRHGRVEVIFPRQHNMYLLSTTSLHQYQRPNVSRKGVSLPRAPDFRNRHYITAKAEYRALATTQSSTSSTSTITTDPVIPSSNNNTERLAKIIFQLHLKHGHVNYHRLIKMIKNESIILNQRINISQESAIINHLRSIPCIGCLKGKMTRSAMTGSIDYHIEDIMDMWVFDTMIPIIPTISGNKYITLVMDVYSSEVFVGLHRTKDEIPPYLINLIKTHQTQLNMILKRLHSDNGTEVKNDIVKAFLDSQGTIHTTSIPNMPQHNSLIERKNRTEIEMSKSMMHHACAYIGLYGEAFVCSGYILNRTVNTRDEKKTPLEIRTGRKPNTSHFHVWGCDVYYVLDQKKRENKFDTKARIGIFVGYDAHNDLYYRIFNVDEERIVISYSCVFHDDRFTEMKRLCNIKNNEEDDINLSNNVLLNSMKVSINDFLPDSFFRSEEAVASVFGDEGTNKNEVITPHDKNDRSSRRSNKRRRDADERETVEDSNASTSHNENNIEDEKEAISNDVNDDNDTDDRNKMNIDENIKIDVNDAGTRTFRRSSRSTMRPEKYSALARTISRPFRMDPNDYALLVLDEPITYKQAVECDESDKWRTAIQDEFDAHEKNNTWSIIDRHPHMNVIGCKWVFKKKRDAQGNVSKYKARLVAKGFNQQYGIDFRDTFAPVLKYKSLRMILILSVIQDRQLEQLDVKTAFLNASVKEDIYMCIPEGMNIGDTHVLKLNRALYGIKQAPREWHEEIDSYLRSIGYSPCLKDSCIYWKRTRSNDIIIIGLFVDDILSSYSRRDAREWNGDKMKLKKKYELAELGGVQHILGMKVMRTTSTITITQQTYINDKLELFGFDNAKTMTTPEVVTKQRITSEADTALNDQEVNTYRMMVGSLIYASISTRPDITHAVNMISRHMSNPSHEHMIMVKRVFRYEWNTNVRSSIQQRESASRG